MKPLVISVGCLLFIGITIGIGHKLKPPLADAEVNHLGSKLAEWAYNHQQTIRINGKPINYIGEVIWTTYSNGDCRRTTVVKWPSNGENGDAANAVRYNLRKLIEESSCSSPLISLYPSKLDNSEELKELTAEQLAQELNCLGQFEFISAR